jgi:hypothetical protein
MLELISGFVLYVYGVNLQNVSYGATGMSTKIGFIHAVTLRDTYKLRLD